ncbi:hypothetical protein NEOLEDRAFT_1151205 [Neolentinus lepideus HHB14362 ss-1]|uniref:Uncharacterized protein n=1 Tax=Neolentinus lepideus HHB14362 ss-1 TaxID=1314782 RepID=A0A165P7E5_9AGAM|nr:hypothetical protein NEOLEDRAFT_1151205 [Neolentinus lepideus HHB14362 ss-1]
MTGAVEPLQFSRWDLPAGRLAIGAASKSSPPSCVRKATQDHRNRVTGRCSVVSEIARQLVQRSSLEVSLSIQLAMSPPSSSQSDAVPAALWYCTTPRQRRINDAVEHGKSSEPDLMGGQHTDTTRGKGPYNMNEMVSNAEITPLTTIRTSAKTRFQVTIVPSFHIRIPTSLHDRICPRGITGAPRIPTLFSPVGAIVILVAGVKTRLPQVQPPIESSVFMQLLVDIIMKFAWSRSEELTREPRRCLNFTRDHLDEYIAHQEGQPRGPTTLFEAENHALRTSLKRQALRVGLDVAATRPGVGDELISSVRYDIVSALESEPPLPRGDLATSGVQYMWVPTWIGFGKPRNPSCQYSAAFKVDKVAVDPEAKASQHTEHGFTDAAPTHTQIHTRIRHSSIGPAQLTLISERMELRELEAPDIGQPTATPQDEDPPRLAKQDGGVEIKLDSPGRSFDCASATRQNGTPPPPRRRRGDGSS